MSETTCRVCGKYNGPNDSSDWCRCPRVRDSGVSEDAATPSTPQAVTAAMVAEWQERHGLQMHPTDAMAAVSDARTLTAALRTGER